MNHTQRSLLVLLCLLPSLIWANQNTISENSVSGNSSAVFIENNGQITHPDGSAASEVLYTLRTAGLQVFVYKNGLSYQLSAKGDQVDHSAMLPGIDADLADMVVHASERTVRFNVILENANMLARVEALENTPYVEQYFTAKDQNQIRAGSCKKLIVHDIYPGIDWVLYVRDNTIKYDFIVAPGSDPAQIRFLVEGADAISTPQKDILQYGPTSWRCSRCTSFLFITGR